MPGFNEGILGPMTTTLLQKGYVRPSDGFSASDSPSFAGLTLTGLLSGTGATFNGIISAYNGSDYISMIAGTDSYIFAQKGGVNYAIGFKVGGPYYDASSGTVTTKTLSGTNQITLANSFDTIQGRLSGGGVGIIDIRADNGFRVRNLANSAYTPMSASVGTFSTGLYLADGGLVTASGNDYLFPSHVDAAYGLWLRSGNGNPVRSHGMDCDPPSVFLTFKYNSVNRFFIGSDLIEQRNSTNAQAFKVYGSYTDGSTYKRAALSCSTTALTLAFESDSGNGNIILTPKGTGGVGIGTTGPVAPLQVIGKVLLGTYPTNSDAYHEFSSGVGFAVTTNSYSDRYLWYSNSGNLEVINPENVGTSKYFRVGAGYSQLGLLAGGSVMNLMCDNGANSNINFQTKDTGDSVPVTRMTVLSAGNVGIGETSPDYKLDVNGTFGFSPGGSVTPVDNGDVVIEATNNTTLTFKLKGSDGVVRTATLTLA